MLALVNSLHFSPHSQKPNRSGISSSDCAFSNCQGLLRAVANNWGFEPTYAPAATWAPQTDFLSGNRTDTELASHNNVPLFSPNQDAGANAVMASYNAWNGTPMTINPVIRDVVIGKWGVQVISGDAGAVKNLWEDFKLLPDHKTAVVAALKAGLNQYLDTYRDELRAALGIDVVGTLGRKSIFGTEQKDWKPFTMPDGKLEQYLVAASE